MSTIAQKISAYQGSRDTFYNEGGQNFLAARRLLRSCFCDATITPDLLKSHIKQLPTEAERKEFSARFSEWQSKLDLGLLQKTGIRDIPEGFFLRNLTTFCNQYRTIINSQSFAEFNRTRIALRTALLPELKSDLPAVVASRHSITDPDILYRMKNEWCWKQA